MRLAQGIEWAAHGCIVLAYVPEGRGMAADALARFFDLPAAYMAKQMQALRRAEIVASVRGKGGGYRLARPLDRITLADIVAAIEGTAPLFRCTEIRQAGPCPSPPESCRALCPIAAAFRDAEQTWRAALESRTLLDLLGEVSVDPEHAERTAEWVRTHA